MRIGCATTNSQFSRATWLILLLLGGVVSGCAKSESSAMQAAPQDDSRSGSSAAVADGVTASRSDQLADPQSSESSSNSGLAQNGLSQNSSAASETGLATGSEHGTGSRNKSVGETTYDGKTSIGSNTGAFPGLTSSGGNAKWSNSGVNQSGRGSTLAGQDPILGSSLGGGNNLGSGNDRDSGYYVSRTRDPIPLGPTDPQVPLPYRPGAGASVGSQMEDSTGSPAGVAAPDRATAAPQNPGSTATSTLPLNAPEGVSGAPDRSRDSATSDEDYSSWLLDEEAGSEPSSSQVSENATGSDSAAEVSEIGVAAIEQREDGSKLVDVFFATDRAPTSEVVPTMFRTFLPALGVASICWAMFIGLSVARRFQIYWVMGAGLATCLGVMVLHVCILRWQEYSRLASNASTRFSVFRFEPETETDYPLHVGLAEVSVPAGHVKGGYERPSLLKLEFTESEEKHIVLKSIEVEELAENWFAKLSDHVRYASEREGFLFIHGYNVKFGDAIKRTAQLAVDLDVQGPVISYSWPSRGQVALYSADEASVAWSAPNFEKLLVDLKSFTELRKINIVAHSMGNRALLDSIERIHLRSGVQDGSELAEKAIGAMILAAPDVDAQTFRSRYVDAIESVADHATIYFTNDDFALRLSQTIHSAPRLGLGELPSDGAIEGIDTGPGGLFTLGHSYYGSDPVVLDDMRRVLSQRLPASRREYLQECITQTGSRYWKLDRALHASLTTAAIR